MVTDQYVNLLLLLQFYDYLIISTVAVLVPLFVLTTNCQSVAH